MAAAGKQKDRNGENNAKDSGDTIDDMWPDMSLFSFSPRRLLYEKGQQHTNKETYNYRLHL
ncbi:hypothetical protein SPIRO4BDMA_40605 [uncultured spirochete]|jgi:hypothetical protein|uniref:Uncharacterized protein n=1 Tax=uncultured spirochete TaxID=156406 RepID=A0A3P3XQB3_9SPIR|nr:hypothetical protein SPIRO4BDMA_40605 [uncultured spirochete]